MLSDLSLPVLQDPDAMNELLQQLRDLRERRRERLDKEAEEGERTERPGWLRRLRERRRP